MRRLLAQAQASYVAGFPVPLPLPPGPPVRLDSLDYLLVSYRARLINGKSVLPKH